MAVNNINDRRFPSIRLSVLPDSGSEVENVDRFVEVPGCSCAPFAVGGSMLKRSILD